MEESEADRADGMKLIAATQNKHKLEEIEAIVSPLGIEPVSLAQAGLADLEIEESGATLEENSLLKAQIVCRLSGCAAIADDTGLLVDALGGAPGVYSARFAGEHGNDAANRALLLEKLKGLRGRERAARFVTIITLCTPSGQTLVARGECAGLITEEERGTGGFGYDPLFLPDGQQKTFAELSPEEKNAISHRGRALRALREQLAGRGDLFCDAKGDSL